MSDLTETKGTVLVVEDDEGVRRGLFWALKADYRVIEAASRDEAIEMLQHERIDVVLSDLHLPPHVDDMSEGLAIVDAARRERPPVPVVVITGTDSVDAARETVKRGAY